MAKVVIIGGGGYVGSSLCPALVSEGHTVVAYDTFWYGEQVLPHSVQKIKGDMRDLTKLREVLAGADSVIHLACISNDPSFDLNPTLGRSINLDSFAPICEAVRNAGVGRFIYASSSSVYGLQDGEVTEKTVCKPITDYSKFKLACEAHLTNADMGGTVWTIVRPATICGFAPRLRLDLIVNALTISALEHRKIMVHGGAQLRPNLNIRDMVSAYVQLLKTPSALVAKKTFNVGAENWSIKNLADIVAANVLDPELKIEFMETDDLRSYHISSNLISDALRFRCVHGISDAVHSLMQVFSYLNYPSTNPQFHNIKRMKELGI